MASASTPQQRIVPLQAAADGTGTATIKKSPPSGYQWTITHIAVSSTSVLSTTAKVNQNSNFICGTSSGNQDTADGTPITLKDGDELSIVWAGATPNAQCNATLLVTEEGK